MAEFVGLSEPLARLRAVYEYAVGEAARVPAPGTGLVLVTGEAGIGKTSLLHLFAAEADRAGATVVWGTCWDAEQAPAWWPWTEALRRLLGHRPDLIPPAEVGPVLPDDRPSAARVDRPAEPEGRVRVLDGVARLLSLAAADAPVVVILDDLQWSDPSTLDLVRFLVRRPPEGRVLLVGAYRPAEPSREVAAGLAELAMSAELIPLQSLTQDEVTALVVAVAGDAAAARWAVDVHRRSGGHPFFARELCRLVATGGDPEAIPPAVRGVILRRLDVVSAECADLLEVAAVVGSQRSAELLGVVGGQPPERVLDLLDEAVEAGILTERGDLGSFAHDLYREGVLGSIQGARRRDLHHRTARALAHRRQQGSPVFPRDLARHAAAALPAASPEDAIGWAHEAAAAEEARFAFAEAAGHLRRVHDAVIEAGVDVSGDELIGLDVAEAELRLKAGDAPSARRLLDSAWTEARTRGEADVMGQVALGMDRCGARFAMPRQQLLTVLEAARTALQGSSGAAEAQVTAALARQLQHSVPADRPRSRPLAEQAVSIARDLDDPATLATCLLAQHDSLWTPGTAPRRVEISAEIAGVARAAGDTERLAQALLLTASAQLEAGEPAFRATAREYALVTEGLHQPRHDYLLRTRRAALALLDGDIATGERLSAEAAELGEAVGDTDAGNVRMSQRLEIVRAGGDAGQLRELAGEAVQWWVGAPAHAHAIAAGFLARAGDLAASRRALDTVLSLDDWRTDRSYLWSVFVGELATAAIALDDRDLCRRLVDDLRPLAATCAVNGALVCFMGAHSHRLGLLHGALGEQREARRLLTDALYTHQRLGARVWEAETAAALAEVTGAEVSLLPKGALWEVAYQGRSATMRDCKGLRDLAVLVARPGVDVPALELVAGRTEGADPTARRDPVVDRTALRAYRRRLDELDQELADASELSDLSREARATEEKEQLLAELRRSTRPGGGSRLWGTNEVERARKAVSARIRDAIGRIEEAHPDLGTHLGRSVTTGTACRYEPRSG